MNTLEAASCHKSETTGVDQWRENHGLPPGVVGYKYTWNPAHPIGTCADCGGEMVHNCPRLGANGGYIHKETGSVLCGPRPELAVEAFNLAQHEQAK